MVFTMYRIYNRQRKQEKTERALPLSHKHFIPPLYTYVYRKDQVSPVPGLFVFYSRPPRFALYCLLPQAGSSLMVQEKQMPPAVPLVFLLDSLYHDWLSSSFLYAANAFGIGYFSFNSPLSANSIPGISSPAFTRYPLICHSTWLKICLAFPSGSTLSTVTPCSFSVSYTHLTLPTT